MAIPRLSDRIRTAITAAAESLPRSAGSVAADRALPSPGDLYVFDAGDEVGIEWLVVRSHPDDPDLILLAPIDDCPLTGTPDLVLPAEHVGRPMTVRCGQTDWVPQSLFSPSCRVGTIPDDVVALVKRRLADLARGRALTSEGPAADFDPEYEDWMAEVAQAREALVAWGELRVMVPKTEQASESVPEFVLAAEPGGRFFESLSQPIVAELAAVADETLWHTNPVWCLQRLEKRQPEIAACLRRALPRTNPGVVGMVVDVITHDALLVPLVVERSSEWHVDPTLPFRQPGKLPNLLGHLLRSLGLPNLSGVPERFAFTLRDPLGRRSDGPSMHLAGLLAVIRHANGNPALFDRACCVVQPEGDRLVPVGSIQLKLAAFRRECETGTLLVRCRGSEAVFDADFDTVWEVDSLRELASILEREGLLRVFLDGQPLSGVDAKTVATRVHQLEGTEHRYAEALHLSQRAERAGFCPDVPNRVRREFRQNIIDLYRHLGAYKKTAELAQEEHLRSKSSLIQSYEDQAQADVTYAAALYAPHRFTAIHELLDPWRERLKTDPLLVTPLTQMKVFNTLGRAWVASGRDGWKDLFRRSEEILQELEPTDLPRTWCYLAQGYLRSGRLREAEDVLSRIEAHPGLGEMSRWFLRILQADLARRQGSIWTDPEMERATVSTRVGHPFAFYLQATARQPGRQVDDALDRSQRARGFLAQDEPDGDPQNIQRFLTDCLLLAEAAWMVDQARWDRAVSAIESYLVAPGGDDLANHYSGCVPAKGSSPDRAAAERLLNRVPFF